MKNYKLLLYTFSIIGLMLTSCDPSVEAPGSKDISEITFLPLITLEGGNVVLDCEATSYEDPGASASAGGVPIDLNTDVIGKYYGGSAVEDGPDSYLVAYSAFNADDIPAVNNREVLFPPCNGDLVTSIAGTYSCFVARNGGTPYEEFFEPFIIRDLGDNRYAISDAQGGWYEYGRGLGLPYATLGMVVVANDISANDFTAEGTVTTNTFGGDNTFTSLVVDPVAKTLTLTVDWSFGFEFVSIWTQVEQ